MDNHVIEDTFTYADKADPEHPALIDVYDLEDKTWKVARVEVPFECQVSLRLKRTYKRPERKGG